MQFHHMASELSKRDLGNLAIESALEFERANAGEVFEKSRLAAFCEALRVSIGERDITDGSMPDYMRPGYFEPFERVYVSCNQGKIPQSAMEIRSYIREIISEIDLFRRDERMNADSVTKFVDFCLELRRSLV